MLTTVEAFIRLMTFLFVKLPLMLLLMMLGMAILCSLLMSIV